jgi:hypothetical protein
MIKYARDTPLEVSEWLRERLQFMPDNPILIALATDDRMSALWSEVKDWEPGPQVIVQLADFFSAPRLLSSLEVPPEERVGLSWPEQPLGLAAENLVFLLVSWPDAAAKLWGEPIDELAKRLRAFAIAALKRASAKQSAYDYIPEPSRRGRGNRNQLAFREAIYQTLQRLSQGHPLSRERQDVIVATLSTVVFQQPVDVETVRRHRQRQKRKQASRDN